MKRQRGRAYGSTSLHVPFEHANRLFVAPGTEMHEPEHVQVRSSDVLRVEAQRGGDRLVSHVDIPGHQMGKRREELDVGVAGLQFERAPGTGDGFFMLARRCQCQSPGPNTPGRTNHRGPAPR